MNFERTETFDTATFMPQIFLGARNIHTQTHTHPHSSLFKEQESSAQPCLSACVFPAVSSHDHQGPALYNLPLLAPDQS